jgi:hypothetical protein
VRRLHVSSFFIRTSSFEIQCLVAQKVREARMSGELTGN